MIRSRSMRYAVWNNKGGVGKSFLSFVLGTEIAHRKPEQPVILVDMCPQANLSEIVLGGNGAGADRLQKILSAKSRKTVGGYFDSRIDSPQRKNGHESDYLLPAHEYNRHLPKNLWLIAGDPSLELQAQVISQIGGQTLPQDSWRNVRNWLKDLVGECIGRVGTEDNVMVFIDCNPSFAAYTELAMIAADRLIIPCSSDGSSARAIDNIGALLYGIGATYGDVDFEAKAVKFGMPLPLIHSVLLNRSTLYSKKASKAFGAMFDEIKRRARRLQKTDPGRFVPGKGINFKVVPDNHSVAIVCSHLGRPLYSITPGQYTVHDTYPQVNDEPLDRYKEAVDELLASV
ncbi:MAG: ParA family protein [Planctomycetota bacterium]